jgi:superfamily II helicase
VIADRARFRAVRKLERATGMRIPDLAFHGAFLEAVSSGINFEYLDGPLRAQLLEFVREFLSCGCRNSPDCGCPERRFARKVLELREEGLDHRQISAQLLEEYGIDLYPADILSYLEESVHVLEAIREVAAIQGRKSLGGNCDRHLRMIVG